MQFHCLKGWRTSLASLRPLVESSVFLCRCPACQLESFRVAFWSCAPENTGTLQAALQRSGKGSSPRSCGVAAAAVPHTFECILKGNPVAMPIASPTKPSVGAEGKVRYVWGKPNWRKGRKQEVISNFLMVHIFRWLSNGHLPTYVNTSLCTCLRDSYSIDAVWLLFFLSLPPSPHMAAAQKGPALILIEFTFLKIRGF